MVGYFRVSCPARVEQLAQTLLRVRIPQHRTPTIPTQTCQQGICRAVQTDEAAVVVHIEGGSEPRVSREGREPGTTMIVQNLFFNTPGRRKFLKSPNTEFRHIYDVVQLSLLANVHYTFNRQFEVYGGIRPGYYFDSYGNDNVGENASIDASSMDGFNNQFIFGARYYIMPQLGIYTRMLIDDFGAEAGLTFKF